MSTFSRKTKNFRRGIQRALDPNSLVMRSASAAFYRTRCAAYEESLPFLRHETEGLPPPAARTFRKDAETSQVDFFACYKGKGYIDPAHGLIVTADRQVIRQASAYAKSPKIPNPSYIAYRRQREQAEHIPRLISIPCGWNNYYHFYHEALGFLLKYCMPLLEEGVPVLLPSAAKQRSFVQQLLPQVKGLEKVQWIYHDPARWIVSDEIYFGNKSLNAREDMEAILARLDLPEPSGLEKIVIKRTGAARRQLRNQDELISAAESKGFTAVDPGSLTVREQMALFSGATDIIAEHGAALTNMMYCRNPDVRITEIFPRDRTPPHYFWMARELGLHYQAVVGSRLSRSARYFSVETSVLFNPSESDM
jgi:capsular polysaccharide biosynthesis protein